MQEKSFYCEAVRDGLKIKLDEPVHSVKVELTQFVLNFFELETKVTAVQLFETVLCEIPISTVIVTRESIEDWLFSIKKEKQLAERKNIVRMNISNRLDPHENNEAMSA